MTRPNLIYLPRFVSQQVAGGSIRVHALPQHGEAAALPQHHQERPRHHRQPRLPHVPRHQVSHEL